MKNIHLFETEAAYNAVKSGLILPRLSYIEENNNVKYNPQFDANGHDYVEIAGIKWATMNVGANSITDYGLYFQWGDTQGYTAQEIKDGKKGFADDWSDYKFTTDGGKTFTKYKGKDGKNELDLEDDAVHAAWGGSWRMPTTDEFEKLGKAVATSAVTANWTSEYNGTSVAGHEIHDKKTNDTLFLPACGYANDGEVFLTGISGYYWLSSLNADFVKSAYTFLFSSDTIRLGFDYGRYKGLCVRGVLAEN